MSDAVLANEKRSLLLQGNERGAYLVICRPLSIICLDLRPRHDSLLVDHVDRGVRYAGELSAIVSRVVQTVSVNRSMIRIREQRKVDLAPPIGRKLGGKILADVGRIDANGIQLYVLFFLQKRA